MNICKINDVLRKENIGNTYNIYDSESGRFLRKCYLSDTGALILDSKTHTPITDIYGLWDLVNNFEYKKSEEGEVTDGKELFIILITNKAVTLKCDDKKLHCRYEKQNNNHGTWFINNKDTRISKSEELAKKLMKSYKVICVLDECINLNTVNRSLYKDIL